MKGSQAAVVGAALIACAGSSCARRTEMVASRYIKSVPVAASTGALITVTSEESVELAGTALDIPAGALARDTTITLELGYQSILRAPAEAAGSVAIWGPGGTTFRVPVSLKIPYRPSATLRAQELYVEVLEDNGQRQTFTQPGLSVDPTAGLLALTTIGFSSFQPGAHSTEAGGADGPRAEPDGSAPRRDGGGDSGISDIERCSKYCAAVGAAVRANGCPMSPACGDICMSALRGKCPAETGRLYDCATTRPTLEWQCSTAPPGAALRPEACATEQSALTICSMH